VTPVSANDGINILKDDQPPNGTASVTRINDDLNKLDQLRAERRNCNRDSFPRSRRYSNNDMAKKFRLQLKLAGTFCRELSTP